MNDRVFIYSLVEPATGKVLYVGKATDPTKRLAQHTAGVRKAAKLLGLTEYTIHCMQILEECTAENWRERELFHISQHRLSGAKLANSHDAPRPIKSRKGADPESFASRIIEARDRLGLTQAQAAALLDISKSTLEKWEAGTKEPLQLAQEGALARLAKRKTIARKLRKK